MWAELEDVSTGKILMSLSWLPASKERADLQGIEYIFLLIRVHNFDNK